MPLNVRPARQASRRAPPPDLAGVGGVSFPGMRAHGVPIIDSRVEPSTLERSLRPASPRSSAMSDLPASFLETYFWTDSSASLPERFIVVTACNPDGVLAAMEWNEAADARLLAELVRDGCAPFRVTGGSQDRRHLEPGWGIAVDAPHPLGPRLSVAYRQLAFFWVADGIVWLVDTATGRQSRVALWQERAMR